MNILSYNEIMGILLKYANDMLPFFADANRQYPGANTANEIIINLKDMIKEYQKQNNQEAINALNQVINSINQKVFNK